MREIMFEQNALHLEMCIKLVKEVIEGLRELHKFNIIHSYITPEAVIKSKEKYLLATLDRDILGLLRNYGLTLYSDSIYYSAPELLREGRSSVSSDIYSIGILLFRLITRTLPFIDLNPKNAREQIIENRLNFVALRGYDNYDALLGFFERCLNIEPSNRFSDIEELLDGLKKVKEGITYASRKNEAIAENKKVEANNKFSLFTGYIGKGAIAATAIAAVILIYFFFGEISSVFKSTKEIEQIVVEITPGATDYNAESPMIHEEIEYLIQEKLVRSGSVSVLGGEQFKALRETEKRMEYVPKILIKGELNRSSAGYELAPAFFTGRNSIFDTIVSFNEPATFLTTILAPLPEKKKSFRGKKDQNRKRYQCLCKLGCSYELSERKKSLVQNGQNCCNY
ncbi:MAG: protein kinase [Ignavibacteriales bacterium]|nr:protein kinase [Ignavibacteriales bacterium]